MKLAEICEELTYTCLQGEMEKEISDIIYDSRKVEKDTIFVCMVGAVVDGHDFVEDAVKKGAAALVVEHAVEIDIPENCTVLQVEDARYALAIMSAAFFGHPDRELTTIGLTGTKGKTTTTYMIKSVLEEAGKKVGLIGTIGALIGEEKLPAKNTTPESYELHKMFRAMLAPIKKVGTISPPLKPAPRVRAVKVIFKRKASGATVPSKHLEIILTPVPL